MHMQYIVMHALYMCMYMYIHMYPGCTHASLSCVCVDIVGWLLGVHLEARCQRGMWTVCVHVLVQYSMCVGCVDSAEMFLHWTDVTREAILE